MFRVLAASPVVRVNVRLAVRLEPGTIDRRCVPSVSLTVSPVLLSATDVMSVFAPDAAAPRFVLAPAAVEEPVPPSATAKSVMPEIDPPVIDTLLAFWVAIVPRPRLVLAVAASDAPVPPSATARSVIPETDPPVIETLLAFCVAIVPRPRVVLCAEASASSIRAAPAVLTVTLDALMSSVLAASPVVSVNVRFAVRLDPGTIERRWDASVSRTVRPVLFRATDVISVLAPDAAAPRFVRAPAAVDDPVPPSATARSVMPVIVPPVIATDDASWFARDPVIIRASIPST